MKHICIIIFFTLSISLACTTLFSPPAIGAPVHVPNQIVHSEKGLEIDQFLSRLQKFGFHGSVLVAQKGEVVLHKAYGIAQPINNTQWETSTPASIGSVVKQFTGSAILKLEMQGKLSTNDLITKYFKSVPSDKQSITLHHLLTHSAGLPGALGDDFEAITKDEYLEQALAVELASTPGELYEYSNVGFSLLAMIVEQVSGIGYEEFLRKEFFDPLGMEKTGWRIPKWEPIQVSQSHENPTGENSLLDLPSERWHIEGNGGLYSTPSDMYRWHLALQGDDVLSANAKQKMFTRHIPEGPDANSFYGYGWVVMDTRRGGDIIWHDGGGSAGAFATYHYVNDSAVFIVFTNKHMSGDYPMGDVAIYSSMILFGDEYPTPPEVVTVSGKNFKNRDGIYAIGDGSILTVKSSADALEISPQGQSAMNALFPSEMAQLLDKYNSKSEALIEALGSGDFTTAAQMFEPFAPLEEITQMLKEDWSQLDSLGNLVSSISHGVRMGEMAEAYLTVEFTGGKVNLKCGWMTGKCYGYRTGASTPSLLAKPIVGGAFASFSLREGATTARFDKNRILIITGPKGKIRAERTN